jgi:hypothetical protein
VNLTNREIRNLLCFIEIEINKKKRMLLLDGLSLKSKKRYQSDIDYIEPILDKMKGQLQDEQIYISIERQ